MYKPNDKPFEIPNPQDIQKLQRKDALQTDESYDIDIEEKKAQARVQEEHIEPSPPPDKKEEVFFDDLDEKYMLPDEDIEEETPVEPPVFEDSEPVKIKDGKSLSKEREYLNRKDTIFEEPPDLPKSTAIMEAPKKKVGTLAKPTPPRKKAPPAKEEEAANTYSNIVTFFAVIFFAALVIFFFAILLHLSANNSKLTEAEKLQVIEMSTFLSYNEEFVSGMNELSDQKKLLIESYIKGTRNKEELFLELLAIDKKEQEIIDLFNENSWTSESVKNLNNMTYDFLSSNKQNTKDLLDKLYKSSKKADVLQIYNDGVAYHETQIYTINQYAQQEVDKLGVDTIIEGKAIQIDLTKVR